MLLWQFLSVGCSMIHETSVVLAVKLGAAHLVKATTDHLGIIGAPLTMGTAKATTDQLGIGAPSTTGTATIINAATTEKEGMETQRTVTTALPPLLDLAVAARTMMTMIVVVPVKNHGMTPHHWDASGHPTLNRLGLLFCLMLDQECFTSRRVISSMIPKPNCITAIRSSNISGTMRIRSLMRFSQLGRLTERVASRSRERLEGKELKESLCPR